MYFTSLDSMGLRFSRNSAALWRKFTYSVLHLLAVDSFEPIKRLFDLIVAGVALIVASPILLGWVMHRKISGRPLLTCTERVGKFGRKFMQYRFAGLKGHPSLRNAPLLVNVLVGDMSIVGPRAASADEPIIESNGRVRLAVKPGVICSWWLRQRASIDFDDEATADREYLNMASLASDIGIALRAIPALVLSERPMSPLRTVEILGLRIDNLTMAQTLDWIRHKLNEEGPAIVCMTNAHCANVSCVNVAYRQTLLASSLNVPDGVGLRIAGKLKRTPIRQNVNGTDLFPRLCAMISGTSESVYLLGGQPGVAEQLARWIAANYPGAAVAGYRDGYFHPSKSNEVADAIKVSGATMLLVAMGVPAQELWIRRNVERTGVRIAIGVGGLFDFYSGRIPRAPLWMREIGLEWTYRLLQEPGRMWRRYLIGNWAFLMRHVLYELKFYHPHSEKHAQS